MNKTIIRLILNVAGLYLAINIVPGIRFDGQWWALVLIAVIFGLVNALVRPLLMGMSCLINVVTLGLFTFVINALMLWLTSAISGLIGPQLNFSFTIDGFLPALLGAIVISVFSFLLSFLVRDGKRRR